MSLFVEAEESSDRSVMYSASAFVRSAHKDVHQLRRRAIAGKKAHQLDVRVDADHTSLISRTEEAKMKKTWGWGQGGLKGSNCKDSCKDNTAGKSYTSFWSWRKKGEKGKGGRAGSSSAHSNKK